MTRSSTTAEAVPGAGSDPRAVACIDCAAVRANFAEARRAADGTDVIAVVKADAYGHGLGIVAPALAEAGCRDFAVVTLDEARALRACGVEGSVLLLGGVDDAAAAEQAARLGATPVLHGAEPLDALAAGARRAGASLDVHVEVDTGMCRMGVPPQSASAFVEKVAREPALRLAGLMTHYARADEPDLAPSLAQLALFRDVLDTLRARAIDPGRVHVANSAGLLAGRALRAALPGVTAVRPGLMLYGVSPAPHFEAALAPVMTLRARVVAVRPARRGEGVGYGAEYRAPRETRIATLGIGYADGLPVSASNRGHVLLAGRRRPLVGRVSMDTVGVEVGDAPVAVGDEALLFGAQGGDRLTVEEAASAAGTIAYELLVRVGARVARVAV